jgi:hypothetical protein
MNNANSEKKVLVQVVPVDEGREIGWGESTAEQLRNRLGVITFFVPFFPLSDRRRKRLQQHMQREHAS